MMNCLQLKPIIRSYNEYSEGFECQGQPIESVDDPSLVTDKVISSSDTISKDEPMLALHKAGMRTTSDMFHYNKLANRCETCRAYCLSNSLLDIHLMEHHDSFFECLAARKPSYKCIVAGCSVLCWSVEERNQHVGLIHAYPASTLRILLNINYDSSSNGKGYSTLGRGRGRGIKDKYAGSGRGDSRGGGRGRGRGGGRGLGSTAPLTSESMDV